METREVGTYVVGSHIHARLCAHCWLRTIDQRSLTAEQCDRWHTARRESPTGAVVLTHDEYNAIPPAAWRCGGAS